MRMLCSWNPCACTGGSSGFSQGLTAEGMRPYRGGQGHRCPCLPLQPSSAACCHQFATSQTCRKLFSAWPGQARTMPAHVVMPGFQEPLPFLLVCEGR